MLATAVMNGQPIESGHKHQWHLEIRLTLTCRLNYRDAMKVDEERWRAAMDIEYGMHMTKHTWDLVDAPEGRKHHGL